MGNSVSPGAPEAAEQHLNGMCTASWCEMSSAESTGKRTCSGTGPALTLQCVHSRSQTPKAAREEMPHSRKFRVTKTTNKTKNPSVDACMTLSGHLTLHWMESIFSTKEDTSRKAIQKVASARALGLALSTELDNSEPRLQIYHFLTNNHVTLLMSSKETRSQLWLKGDSTHFYVFNIHLIPLTIELKELTQWLKGTIKRN